MQVGFKRQLLLEVRAFVLDAMAFRQDWEANGPTVPGLDPLEATDRLRKFQQLFEVGGAALVGGGRRARRRAGEGAAPQRTPCAPPRPQVRKRKWVGYSDGEELFGLPVTQFPELERTEEEITMLDKLYR